ncbi:MAG TPA: response regulator, partial [Myxococcaceae bacterium]|nr:response regulator [Myxococcaceae bacterium]
ICNEKYREIHPRVASAMVPGVAFEELTRIAAKTGIAKESGVSEDEWFRQRLLEFRNPGEPVDQKLNGRWLRIADRRTRAGGTVGLRTDISTIKRDQEELKLAKEAAESATRAKSEFLARMSHEIRTPMNGVLGMTELALRTPLSPEQHDYLSTVRSSATSLLEIINDILDFSKAEARKLRLESSPFRLRDSLGDVLKGLSARAQDKGLELMYSVSPDVPDRLVGDAHRLRQLVVNLVGNALKFTEAGEVVVDVTCDARFADEVALRFCVADTGPGIPPEKHERIFEPFGQADAGTARTYGGTGLGLAICSQLAGLMGGSVWVESALGEGSRFYFTARFPTDLSAVSEPSAPRLKDFSVLVAVHNAKHRLILQEMLQGWRMAVRSVPGAEAALHALRQAREVGTAFGLLIADADLPAGEARLLAEALNADEPCRTTPVLWLTSSQSTDEAMTLLRAPAARYAKPVVPSPLLERIRDLVLGGEATSVPVAPVKADVTTHPLRVLVADDNAVNRKVATRLLELAGHRCVAVEDGQAAAEAADAGGFDAVLMDVQMPRMDGLAATRLIRQREAASGSARLPVIALTAQAMRGDQELCLEAGMDAYVTKPIDPAVLLATLERVTAGRGDFEPPAGAVPVEPARPLDVPTLRRLTGGIPELLTEVVQLYLADAPTLLEEVEVSCASGDADGLAKSAHKLKGALLTLAAGPASEAARSLEMLGREGRVADASDSLRTLRVELSRLHHALQTGVAA